MAPPFNSVMHGSDGIRNVV